MTNSYKGRSLIIPLTSPVKFAISTAAARKNIIEPYVLGALLGDGCISKKYPELTTMDQDIVDRFTVYGYDMSKISKKQTVKLLNTISIQTNWPKRSRS